MNSKELGKLSNEVCAKWREAHAKIISGNHNTDNIKGTKTFNVDSVSSSVFKRKNEKILNNNDNKKEEENVKINIPVGKAISFIDPNTGGFVNDGFPMDSPTGYLSKEEIEVNKLIDLRSIPTEKERKEFVDYVINDKFQVILAEVADRVTGYRFISFTNPKKFVLADLTNTVTISADNGKVTRFVK